MITQIYAVTNINEALRVAGIGIDHIGVIASNGGYPWEVRYFKAREILLSLPKDKKGVVFTQSPDLIEIDKIITETEPDILHIASQLEVILPQHIETIKKKYPKLEIMRTIPVVGEESVVAAMMYDGVCDYLFLDTKSGKTGQVGFTGESHDLKLDKKIIEAVATRVIISGGLGSDNVANAIYDVGPYGVNSKTKTDKIGGHEKDLIKVKMFVDKVKTTI